MPLALPDAEDTALARAPLAVVVGQVRYEQNLRIGDGDTILKIHEDLGGRDGAYPNVEPQQVFSAQVEVGPNGLTPLAAGGLPQKGWRLRSTDAKWVISIMPDFVSIETLAYTSWQGDFRDRFESLLASLATHVRPNIVERAGLRYVNRLTDPDRTEVGDWFGAVTEELLGPVADGFWSAGILGFQQQVDLDLGGDNRCTFRQGMIVDTPGSPRGYLLDYDIYRQVPERFEQSRVISMFDTFNHDALALFQKSLTSEYLLSLRIE